MSFKTDFPELKDKQLVYDGDVINLNWYNKIQKENVVGGKECEEGEYIKIKYIKEHCKSNQQVREAISNFTTFIDTKDREEMAKRIIIGLIELHKELELEKTQ